ncbi:AarF/UbiB family protein [Paenisporosarcina quisquiliarum]|uniref:AarF/UbiB family protein n=1 Tax=Paenisporosarcina quisquiliarum TaxID=365346 RepID=A0A9X3LI97_9BACL|nr:AarF/UbiB family protein [Paenisporosarcina quisquiliarum]MCZ8537516.1 AarF/UbiB family protein [Paenisporosarcina quisquiliarum]
MERLAIYRIYRIVWMSVKFFTQVTLFQRRYKGRFTPAVNEKWERLVTRQAKEYKRTALKLGGLMIKMGQFLSTRADIMPPSFIAELEGLTDRVPAVPRARAIELLEQEWNAVHTDTIMNLSDKPVASASIGEVYKGNLKDGTPVAVKIQRPDIERILRADFRAMKIVIWLAKRFTAFGKQINFNLLYSEMVNTIGAELNFLQELRNGRSFADRFASMPGVRFPVYYDEFSTRRVLVMEWIEGARITDLAFIDANGINRRNLSERLFRLFLEQVLDGGQFHADPHGGNILIKPDGTIVLIDFGMVGSISKEEARSVLKVVEGVLLKQYDRVLDGLEELRFLLPQADRRLLANAIARVVAAYESEELTQMDSFVVDRLLDDLKGIVRTQPVQLPAEFAFFGRAVSTFIGVLHVLDPKVDLLAIARPRVLEWATTQKDGDQSFSKEDAVRFALKAIGPFREIPQKVLTFLDEPTRMREYMQIRDAESKMLRYRLQTRMFAGIISVLSLGTGFYAIWDEHSPLMVTSGIFFVASAWVYRGKSYN